MKATISEIVPERLNVSYVAFSFDPPPSGLGRLLPHILLQTSHCGDITRVERPMAPVDSLLTATDDRCPALR